MHQKLSHIDYQLKKLILLSACRRYISAMPCCSSLMPFGRVKGGVSNMLESVLQLIIVNSVSWHFSIIWFLTHQIMHTGWMYFKKQTVNWNRATFHFEYSKIQNKEGRQHWRPPTKENIKQGLGKNKTVLQTERKKILFSFMKLPQAHLWFWTQWYMLIYVYI